MDSDQTDKLNFSLKVISLINGIVIFLGLNNNIVYFVNQIHFTCVKIHVDSHCIKTFRNTYLWKINLN